MQNVETVKSRDDLLDCIPWDSKHAGIYSRLDYQIAIVNRVADTCSRTRTKIIHKFVEPG
jgi:hypothetical protein